jgi:Na+/glutamate symporter
VVPGYYFWNGTAWIQISNGLIVDASKTSSFSIVAADNNKLFLINSSTSVTVTVPSGLPIGFACQFIQTGAGAVILLGGSGVTLNSANGLTSRAANSAVGLVMSSSTLGYVFGDTIN